MPEYLAPGVYVEEIQTGNKPIEGVSTSTSGLIGVTERGPVNVPQLVTSYGEYRRLFGGYLLASDFTDGTGRVHAYLPHAIEGFFINGGKRAYITRVLPDVATFAARNLFFADPSLATTSGDTVLLRPAQQATGTAVNLPLLYVLDPDNFLVDDWVRIGDGSRTEYRQIANIGGAQRHVALNFPLHNAHASGTAVRALPVKPADTPIVDPTFQLIDATEPGATEMVIDSGDDVNLAAALPAGTPIADWLVVEVGTTAAAEYAYARQAESLGGGQVRLTLAQPLRLSHAALTAVTVLDTTGGTADTLALPANAGELLAYVTTAPQPAAFTDVANLILFEPSTDFQEAHSIGELSTLSLLVPTYGAYPAGTIGQLVAAADDDRQVAALAEAPFVTVALNDVTGLAIGMTLTFIVNTESRDIVTIDDTVMPPTVKVAALSGAPAFPSVVTALGVAERQVAALAMMPFETVALDSIVDLEPGMTLTFIAPGTERTEPRVIDAIDAIATPPTVTLRTALSGAPAFPSAVTVPAKTLTADAAAGAVSVALNDRLGIAEGDVVSIGTDEIAIVREVVGERGAPPDAGAVILEQALRADHPATITEVRRQIFTGDPTRQPAYLILGAAAGAGEVLVNDGTSYVNGDVVRFTLPDTSEVFHRLSANDPQGPQEIELSAALERGHDAGLPFVERTPLLEIRALDAGSWGDRLLVACREETTGLVANAEVLNANPPPGPGMFSSLQLSSLTGVEPGTILEVLDPNGNPLNLAFLKVRRLDRPNRLALLDLPGLQGDHMSAHNNALLNGQRLRLRSREFSLIVMLRQQPDPAVPTRDENLLDQEVIRHLSMDPRHSRYVMRIVGATWTPGNPDDDLGIPLRRWDRRSEGASDYVRVLDLEADPADREAIRLGPEALVDLMPSGLTRPARHPFSGGNDAVVTMNDAMFTGIDNTEPELRTGLYTLKNLLNVSLVAIPGETSAALQQAVIDHCEEMRYRFAVLDGPKPPNDTLTDVQNHRQQYDTKYAALYHPWLMLPDPFPTSLATIRQYPIPPSGHMLGIYARVDNERGVHKAPANEVVRGIMGLTRYFTKGEQDILNPYPVNINVVRDFRPNNRAIRVWGARCITSDSDFKYVNVRRLLIFLEDSIDRGLQWVVFEPNAEALWARVRRSVINFLTTVWRNGALEGITPEQGFFVKCDRTTMTRDDIDNGRLICVIGVAPVKPAEFVIIRIGLWTADAEQ